MLGWQFLEPEHNVGKVEVPHGKREIGAGIIHIRGFNANGAGNVQDGRPDVECGNLS